MNDGSLVEMQLAEYIESGLLVLAAAFMVGLCVYIARRILK